jgi:pre-mRNA-processing factor 6
MSRSSEIREMRGIRPRSVPTYGGSHAPSNYVPGLGRGAVGFTTRSDIGPAGAPPTPGAPAPGVPAVPNFGPAPAGYVAGRGRGMGELARSQADGGGPGSAQQPPGSADRMDYSESNYDEFSGYSETLFGDTPYEADDAEADRVYAEIDEQMEMKRKRKREQARLEELRQRKAGSATKISDQFADLKGKLAGMSSADWEAIPEAGDKSTRRRQPKQKDMFTPLPDNIIGAGRSEMTTAIDPNVPIAGGTSTIGGLAEARGKVLGLNLDRMSDSVSGQTVVDPKGYLTDLNSIKINSEAEVGDIEKARLLLKSVTSTNPKHGPGWIAAARLEEFAGKLVIARKVIKQGCEVCPDNEDVWLEAARLQTPDNAKTVLANAVHHLPQSVKIWLRAAQLESSDIKKKVVLRRALEFVPNSVKLWRTAIELEDEEDARIMLSRAVECVPHSVDMWLALARLETYENARKVLNSAREAIPTDPAIWIHACKLEEAHDNGSVVGRILSKALESLKSFQVVVDRESWLKEAEAAESAGAPLTCAAIIRATVALGVDPEDRKNVWLDDAESALKRGSIETARTIYSEAIKEFPSKKSVWVKAAALERQHGTLEAIEVLLSQAVEHCPQAELLWLMWAKDRWLAGDVPGARSILQRAFAANPNSEQIWLAASKLELENNELARARLLLSKARERAPSGRIWMKSALLEREAGDIQRALALLDEGIQKYPSYAKLYMMAAQYAVCAPEPSETDKAKARAYFAAGLQRCPSNTTLWRLTARFEEQTQGTVKARSTLELARLRNPKSPLLWLEAVRLESRTGSVKAASNAMARALQECPVAGVLWAEEILTVPRQQQKSRSVEALKRCDNDPHVITAVARLFERDRKHAKARKWFVRAITLDPDNGDAWTAYYAFELRNGTEQQQHDVRDQCSAASPAHGELWCSIAKLTENRRLSTADVLHKAALALREAENATALAAAGDMEEDK